MHLKLGGLGINNGGGSGSSSSHECMTTTSTTSSWDSKMPPPLRSRHSGLLLMSPLPSPGLYHPYSSTSRHRRAGSIGTIDSPPGSHRSAHSSMPSPNSSSPHFAPSPSSHSTYEADSPKMMRRKASYGPSTSAVQLVAEAMEDLPNLSEVKTACDAYLDECGDHGASFSLCFVNRNQMDEIWLQACCMQLSRLQLAFLYTVLACVGSATPAGHPDYDLDFLLSPTIQDKYTQIAINLIKSYEGDDRHKAWDDALSQPPASPAISQETRQTPFPNAILRCQLLTMITLLHLNRARYEEAFYFAKQAVTTANTYNLFDTRWWSLYPSISASQIDTIKILQMEIAYCFNWTAMVCESGQSGNLFDPKLPEPTIPTIPLSDPFERAILRQKVEFSALARRLAFTSTRKMVGEEIDPQDYLYEALHLDDELMAMIDSQHPRLRETPRYALIDPNDRPTVRIATMVALVRGGWMHARWRMMQQFFDHHPFDVFQHTAICSARMTLQMLPLVKECFNSPFQSITSRSWIDGHFNQALFIFLMAIKSYLYQSPPPKPASDSHNYSNAIRAELVWFMTNFNRIYNAMNRLRMVRTALSQCAIALRKTPVRINSSSSTSSSTSSPKAPSSPSFGSPDLDAPIFELFDDDDDEDQDDGYHSRTSPSSTRRDDPLKSFIDEYRNHTTFRSAVSTHSPSGGTRHSLPSTRVLSTPSSVR